MSVIVRYAPSPTGLLHIGNIRAALCNWLYALQTGGTFILRYDDTDVDRCKPEFIAAIDRDLAWLGIVPQRREWQSKRFETYAAAAERLKAAGRLYPCYETADELDRRRKRQLARGAPPIYDRAALKLTAEDRTRLAAEGRRPHWRFRLDGRTVGWDDLIRGPQTVDTTSLSDPVLVREDGTYLYTLPSVVDDMEMGISHVIRGEDHVTNTGAQIELFEALGGTPPAFAHHNLLASTTGEAFSKRLGSLSVGALREAGYEPMALASLAVLVGSGEDVRAYATMAELAAHFSLGDLSRSTAKFDPADLDALNARLVHALPFAAVAERLATLGVGGGAALWEAVRPNCVKVSDAADWWRIVEGPIARDGAALDPAFVTAAYDLLPPEPWDETTWGVWSKAVGAATGRKGRDLFMPLRQIVTGLDHGPELKALLPIIGRYRILARRP